MRRPVELDAVDEQLITALIEDGRASYAQLAEQVGLSGPATKRRVDRLLETGVIERFTAVVSSAALGWGAEAFVNVHCTATVKPEVLAVSLAAIPEVVEAFAVTGKADAMVRLQAHDVAHLEQVLQKVRTHPSVSATESVIVLSRMVQRTPPS